MGNDYRVFDFHCIKMITTPKDGTVVYHKGRRMVFGKGAEGLRRAFQYIDIERFIAKVDGRNTMTRISPWYPVRSLIPSVERKTVKITVLSEEVV